MVFTPGALLSPLFVLCLHRFRKVCVALPAAAEAPGSGWANMELVDGGGGGGGGSTHQHYGDRDGGRGDKDRDRDRDRDREGGDDWRGTPTGPHHPRRHPRLASFVVFPLELVWMPLSRRRFPPHPHTCCNCCGLLQLPHRCTQHACFLSMVFTLVRVVRQWAM